MEDAQTKIQTSQKYQQRPNKTKGTQDRNGDTTKTTAERGTDRKHKERQKDKHTKK